MIPINNKEAFLHLHAQSCFGVELSCCCCCCFCRCCRRLNHWWRMTGSNRRPPACKAGALPAELIPQYPVRYRIACRLASCLALQHLVGLVGLEPTTPALSTQCSNQLSYRPKLACKNNMQLSSHAALATSNNNR